MSSPRCELFAPYSKENSEVYAKASEESLNIDGG